MSARKLQLVVSSEAEDDLRGLLSYTEQQWGQQQHRKYLRQFTEAFAELVRFPGLGVARPDLGANFRSFRVGQHIVLYQPSDREVLIVRILHGRRDFNTELG
jgi:toxin ParE1/3/4